MPKHQPRTHKPGQGAKPADKPNISDGLRRRLLSLGIAGLVLVVYGQATHFPFIENWDDGVYVTKNPHVLGGLSVANILWAFGAGYASNWHPLTWLSHMLDVEVFGLDAGKHHLVNVLLHGTNAVLLFAILSRLTNAMWRSAFVGALFAIHPLHVESVAWVAERKDVLSTFFLLITLWSYSAFASSGEKARDYVLAMLWFALGLASKPMLVTTPLLLLLLDVWPLRRWQTGRYRRLIMEKVPFLAFSGVSSILTIVAQRSGGAVVQTQQLPLDARLLNAISSYSKYLVLTIWPAGLRVFYPFPHDIRLPSAVVSLVLLVAITLAVGYARRGAPYLLFGLLWFLISLVPVIGLVQVGSQGLADRYTYIPLIGVFVAIAWGASELAARVRIPSQALSLAASVVVMVLTVQAHTQASYWEDELTLWQHAVDVSPDDSYTANGQVGSILERLGRNDEALLHFRAAVASNPTFPNGHLALGNELMARNRQEEAIAEFREALRLRTNFPEAETALASALASTGRVNEAAPLLRSLLGKDPNNPEAHAALAALLFNQQDFAGSIAEWSEAIRLRPEVPELRNNRGNAFASSGRLSDAISDFEAAIQLDPRLTIAHLSLAQAYLATGRPKEARSEYRTVLGLDPQNAVAKRGLTALGGGDELP